MKNTEILIATSNKGKAKEIRSIFESLNINFLTLDDYPNIIAPDEDGTTFYDNACLKARYYYEKTGVPSLADDSGLVVYSLDNMPGVYSARYAGEEADDEMNNEKLLNALENEKSREAAFVCAAVLYFSPDKIISSEGRVEGTISFEKKGNNGFGYDPVFYLESYGKTMAELSAEIKNKISHRAIALNNLFKKLGS